MAEIGANLLDMHLRRTLSRALQKTFSQWLLPVAVGALGFGISYPVYWITLGREAAWSELMIWVVSLVGAVGAVAILFIINLLRAPYEIAQEKEQRMTSEIEALKLRLSEAETDNRKLVANETIACGMRALDLGRELSLINAELLEAKAQKPEGPHPGPLLKFAGMRRQSESVLLRLDRLGVPIPSVAKMNLDAQWPDLRRISRLESYLKEVGVLLLDGNVERAKEIALTRTAFIDEADAG